MELKVIVGQSPLDHVVEKDGVPLSFDLTGMVASNIWAITWNGDSGEIEYNDGTINEEITDLSGLDTVIAKFDEEKATKDAIDSAPVVPNPKMIGIEFEGVMCSATESDQNGLAAIRPEIEAGVDIPPFKFSNGNRLKLTLDNWEDFRAVWLPFRMSFF